MPVHAQLNACSACARSKRKCGRQTPSCARCTDTGSTCVYPPSKSRAASSSRRLLSAALKRSVPRVEDGLLAEAASNTSSRATDLISSNDFVWDMASPLVDIDFTNPSFLIGTPSVSATRADWFLAPETWTISHEIDPSTSEVASIATVKKYKAVLQSWFEHWVTTSKTPFIHDHLYSASFPACVQVAYATLASYVHRNPANTDTVLQIIEDRSNDLLRENGAVEDGTGMEKWTDEEEKDIDLFAQLTRLHALLVYQIIGLFDGDIRSRHIAEGHIGVQDSWTSKLFRSAAKAFPNTHATTNNLLSSFPKPSTYLQQQWYLWILSESIRRTYFVAVSISTIFSLMQRRLSACPGSIMYTNRNGLWNAASATEWEKQCSGRNVAFMERHKCGKLLEDLKPADLDEFGTAMCDLTLKPDLMEQWRDTNQAYSQYDTCQNC